MLIFLHNLDNWLIAVVRRAAIKQKRELVLFYFYFSFIAVVRAALGYDKKNGCEGRAKTPNCRLFGPSF